MHGHQPLVADAPFFAGLQTPKLTPGAQPLTDHGTGGKCIIYY